MKSFYKYISTTELEEKWGFYITTAGYSKTAANQAYPQNTGHPSTHSFTWNKGRILDGYYLVFISKGEGIFESAHTASRHIIAGTCFFLFPGVWHRYKPDLKCGWEEYWVGFKGSYPDHFMQTFFTSKEPFAEIGLHENMLILFQKLLETVRLGAAGYHQVITGIALQIVAMVHGVLVHEQNYDDPNAQLIAKAKFLLRESMEAPLNMQKLARSLPMGYSKFRKIFKQSTGHSPHQYQLDLRIDKARELLKTTVLHINEIAYQSGFDSVFYFSKLFRKKVGLSPTEYRQQNASI